MRSCSRAIRSRSASDRRLPFGRNLVPELLEAAAAPRLDTLTDREGPLPRDVVGLAELSASAAEADGCEAAPPRVGCRLLPWPPLAGIVNDYRLARRCQARRGAKKEGRVLMWYFRDRRWKKCGCFLHVDALELEVEHSSHSQNFWHGGGRLTIAGQCDLRAGGFCRGCCWPRPTNNLS